MDTELDAGSPELFMGRFLGYRSWTVGNTLEPGGSRLYPIGASSYGWNPGVNTAQCGNYRDHKAPGVDCTCGFWGYYEPHDKRNRFLDEDRPPQVAGVVAMTGIVQMHERGFRAAQAEILALSPMRTPLRPATHAKDAAQYYWGTYGPAYPTRVINTFGALCTCDLCQPKPPDLEALADQYKVKRFDSFNAMVEAFPPTHHNEPKPQQAEDRFLTQLSMPGRPPVSGYVTLTQPPWLPPSWSQSLLSPFVSTAEQQPEPKENP